MKYRHYFFDFDGTLCDTDADIRLAWRNALAEIDLPHADFDSVFRNGPPIDEVTRALFGDEAATPDLIARMRSLFRQHYDESGFPNTKPYPGVEKWLARIKASGANAYIVTNKRYRATNLLVDRLGWRDLFKTVYASDMFMDTPIGKLKKPALLAEAMKREGAASADSVMVGDSANDFEAAHANGLRAIGCAWGYGEPGDLSLADEVLATPYGAEGGSGRFYEKAAAVLEIPAAAPDTRFRDLDGWCSLKAFGILAMMENDFGARIPIGEFSRYSTLGELAALAGGRE